MHDDDGRVSCAITDVGTDTVISTEVVVVAAPAHAEGIITAVLERVRTAVNATGGATASVDRGPSPFKPEPPAATSAQC